MSMRLSSLLAAFALAACAAPDPGPASDEVPARVLAAIPEDLSPREVGQHPDGCWFYVVGGDAFVPLKDADGTPVCT